MKRISKLSKETGVFGKEIKAKEEKKKKRKKVMNE